MANSVFDRYHPKDGGVNAVLSLAEKIAGFAQDEWAGEVLLGMAHYRTGAYEDALAHLEHAEELRIQSEGTPYPDPVAYAAMTLQRLSRKPEAEEALDKLREMFRHETKYDDFQPLVQAEKVFAEGNQPLLAVWDHMEQGHLDKALELLAAASKSA